MSLTILLLLVYLSGCYCVCTYPSNLIGEWQSTSFGLLTFTSTSFSGFTSALSATPLTFTCEVSSGSQYVSKTTNTLFGGVTISTYLCINLQQLSSIKYYLTLDSNRDSGTGIRFYTSSAASVSVSEACTYTDSRRAGEYELLIKADSIGQAFTSCPGGLLTSFSAVMTTQSVADCNGSSLVGSASLLSFNYSSCVTGTLNSGGVLNCLHSVTSDFVYVSLYNNDSTVDGISTFKFTCIAYTASGAIVNATENPNSCSFNQTATYVASPGIQYTMTNLLYVPEQEEDDSNTVMIIIIIVVCFVVIVVIVIIVIIIYLKVCRKPKPEPPPKIRKRKRKPSITDYTANISRSDSIEKGLPIKKTTTGEIISGTLTDNKHALLDSVGYEPPTKKAWQKKWETKLRPATPFCRNDISGLCQTKASSLPDNLDKSLTIPEHDSWNGGISRDKSVSADNIRYSEKSHALTKVPESTGKFGESPTPRIPGSLNSIFDTTLEPIKENPLSREITPTELKHSDVASISARTDNRSILSKAFTTSTLSARDINLTHNSNLRRSSRMSASTASIFDDPTWLNENTKKTDSFFNVVKNLIPGLPSKKIKDQKWFIKTPPTHEISREDIEYFKSRNKRVIGINASDRPSSIKSRDNTEKGRKKSNKPKKTKPIIVRPALPPCGD